MTMTKLADIAVYSPDQRLQLVVEVKNKTNASAEWAANMRRNLFAHGVVPSSPFFLLALSDKFYLWKNVDSPLDIVPPDYEVESVSILAAWLDESKITVSDLSEFGLELAVSSWLSGVMYSDLKLETARADQLWLLDSGLYEAIKDGSIRTEAA